MKVVKDEETIKQQEARILQNTIEWSIRDLFGVLGEDAEREGLQETPSRFIKAMKEMTDGYGADIELILEKTFDVGDANEMIMVKDIEFVSLCEHHLLPFIGTATVAYLPKDRVVGLSKIPRLIDALAHRLQVQERLTMQITTALDQCLSTDGSAAIIEAKHSCMGCRGVRKPNASMVTSSLTGKFKDSSRLRNEFLMLAKS